MAWRQSLALWLLLAVFAVWAGVWVGLGAPIPLAVAGLSVWLVGRAGWAIGGPWPALLAQSAVFMAPPGADLPAVIAVTLMLATSFDAAAKPRAGGGHAVLAAAALAVGMAWDWHLAVLGAVPLLLWDRRRLGLYVALAGAAATAIFLWPVGLHAAAQASAFRGVLTAAWLLSVAMLAAYFRLRRRDLLERDRLARVLAGVVAVQAPAVLAAAPALPILAVAHMLTGPALAIVWRMSRPILPPLAHRRFWWGVAAAVAAQAVLLAKG